MDKVRLGKTDMLVSRVGLGAWQFSGDAWGAITYEQAKAVVAKAAEAGINFFDTAAVYGRGKSEEYLGRALKELGLRGHVYIATKIHGDWLRRADVLTSAENQRRRLGVDAIDLYQVHWPACWHNTPICETMKTLEELVDRGLVRYIGVSNFPVQLLDYARSCLSRVDIATSQNRYNLVEREADKELLPYLKREGIALIAWSPLAKGLLTGKYSAESPPTFEDVRRADPLFLPQNLRLVQPLIDELKRLAAAYGKTPAQIALNWLTRDPSVVPIPGAKTPQQAEENAGAAGWTLSEEDWRRLDALGREISQKITYVAW
ncbi:aldo/keto reductase [Pyrobaculum neutrophilum]|uniref:Aldo/keto reductase n=1 Tax=Pyrobaculum neutrophilum (strain DSM 2338 / JCM 9278 / NBRC 100436 / V24Sta) TaxID=444157 RepID=B1YB04_PYRNV|nr:aldo/keto reductase [Pyrobaculum neutrophilum]ACB40704.1 aldo/keto reductase [Pyrobaculum neutrophilum V24Sta]